MGWLAQVISIAEVGTRSELPEGKLVGDLYRSKWKILMLHLFGAIKRKSFHSSGGGFRCSIIRAKLGWQRGFYQLHTVTLMIFSRHTKNWVELVWGSTKPRRLPKGVVTTGEREQYVIWIEFDMKAKRTKEKAWFIALAWKLMGLSKLCCFELLPNQLTRIDSIYFITSMLLVSNY